MNDHEHTEGVCLITKDEAAELAEVTPRTVELWVSQGKITKYKIGPAGYWVRFCRHEIRAAMDPVAVLIDDALARVSTVSASAGPG
jgi:excisionase family DNA binding protein